MTAQVLEVFSTGIRNGAPSRKGCEVNGHMTKERNILIRPSPPLPRGSMDLRAAAIHDTMITPPPSQGAADRLMERVSSLEAQVLEGRAVLASAETDKGGLVSELAVAREAVGRMEEVKAEMAAAMAREEALRVEIAAQNNALTVRNMPLKA